MGFREIPVYRTYQLREKSHPYCVCIPIIDEGDKIKKQLLLMKQFGISQMADILLFDGGSTDGSTNLDFLRTMEVTTLLVKDGPGKLGAQLRMGYAYGLDVGYQGFITIDGNCKDNIEAIPNFISHLDKGYDFVQGSRFIAGGKAINTPLGRLLAIKLIHAPVISILARYHFTDTTNGYRAYSRRLLLNDKIDIFRNIFDTYQLLFYLSVKAPRLGFRIVEIPVTRTYPKSGKTPSKITGLDNLKIIWTLVELAYGRFNSEK